MKPRKLFDITEPYSREQYNDIFYRVMPELDGHVCVAYQSNWMIVLACTDLDISKELTAKLQRKGVNKSAIEVRRGKKNKERVYVQVKFKRIK